MLIGLRLHTNQNMFRSAGVAKAGTYSHHSERWRQITRPTWCFCHLDDFCSDSSGRQLERDMLDLKRPQDVSLSLFLSTGLKKCSNSSYLQALQYCTFLHTTLTKSDTSKSRSSSARLQNETVRGARRKRSKYSSCWGETSTERLFGDVGLKEDKTINYWARKTTYLKWAQ